MRKIIPFDLGGSPTPCAVAPPQRSSLDVATIDALIAHYRNRWSGREFEAAFFHGGAPTAAMLDAVSGLPVRISLHPADLSADHALRLIGMGVETIELEILTFDPHVLRTCQRAYTTGRAIDMISTLRNYGARVGVHVVPGLPGAGSEVRVEDLRAAKSAGADFVRVWPAIALEGAVLSSWAKQGQWVPWSVDHAIEGVVTLMDAAEALELPIVRVGIQPGHDIPVQATAGPVHPNIRGRVEAIRFGTKLEAALPPNAAGEHVVFLVHPKDLSLAKGTSNANARRLRESKGLSSVEFRVDPSIKRGTVQLDGGAA